MLKERKLVYICKKDLMEDDAVLCRAGEQYEGKDTQLARGVYTRRGGCIELLHLADDILQTHFIETDLRTPAMVADEATKLRKDAEKAKRKVETVKRLKGYLRCAKDESPLFRISSNTVGNAVTLEDANLEGILVKAMEKMVKVLEEELEESAYAHIPFYDV